MLCFCIVNMNSCALYNRIYYLLIWLWVLKGVQSGVKFEPAWCPAVRKPLFLCRGAPRRMGESEHGDGRRGASLPASPCFFIEGHHVIGPGRAFGGAGVVLHRPRTLVSSSRGTTSLALVEPSEGPTWCPAAR